MGDGLEMRQGLGLRGEMRWREEKNRGREGDLRGKVGERWEEGRRAEGMREGW